MSENCPQCGKPVLPDDVVCWHCGQQLPARRRVVEHGRHGAVVERPLAKNVVWLGVTAAALIVLLLMITHQLARQPLVIYDAGIAYQPGWRPFTDANRQFTLEVPPRWQVEEKPLAGLDAAAWESDPSFALALRPYAATSSQADFQLKITGQSRQEAALKGIVTIAWMPQFVTFAPDDILQFIQTQDRVAYMDGGLFEDIHRLEQPIYLFETVDEAGGLVRCLQQVTAVKNKAYLLTACAPKPQFRQFSSDFATILQTFQILETR
ncbi:MAG: zinc ribbon domain-containing protein [Candidatus Thermofonsia bacterium]|nr:MAG: zinc ribbon domain-containing protein [Candidatus Thermofonsia bacterium]